MIVYILHNVNSHIPVVFTIWVFIIRMEDTLSCHFEVYIMASYLLMYKCKWEEVFVCICYVCMHV